MLIGGVLEKSERAAAKLALFDVHAGMLLLVNPVYLCVDGLRAGKAYIVADGHTCCCEKRLDCI